MKVSAWVKNAGSSHELEVSTNETARTFAIPAKGPAGGSAVNGGELLMLALATCFCNDLYREAARLGIAVTAVEVQASAEFEGIGLAASSVSYQARVQSNEPTHRIEQLLRETDAVAEVHNTIRSPVQVRLLPWGSRS